MKYRTLDNVKMVRTAKASVLVNVCNIDDVYDKAPSAYSYLNPTRFLKIVRGHRITEETPNNIVTAKFAPILHLPVFRNCQRHKPRNRLLSAWKIIFYIFIVINDSMLSASAIMYMYVCAYMSHNLK